MSVWILSFTLVFNGQWWIEKDYREFSSKAECEQHFEKEVRSLLEISDVYIFHFECRSERYI